MEYQLIISKMQKQLWNWIRVKAGIISRLHARNMDIKGKLSGISDGNEEYYWNLKVVTIYKMKVRNLP